MVSFKTDLFREEELLLDKKKGLSITKLKEDLAPYLSLEKHDKLWDRGLGKRQLGLVLYPKSRREEKKLVVPVLSLSSSRK